MKIKDIVTLDIIDVNYMGRGVARQDDLVIFVIGAITGDRVRVKITECKKKYCVAEVVELLKSSEHRVKPKCKYFDLCGGCTLMNLTYEKQLEFKNNAVINSFKKSRVSLENTKVNAIIGMENPYRYRNKTAFAIQTDYSKKNPVKIGTYGLRSHRIIDLDECLLQDKKIDYILKTFKKILAKYKVKAYDNRSKTGIIRHIVFRKNYLNEFMIILVTNKENFKEKENLVNDLSKVDKNIVTIVQNINDRGRKEILGNKNIALYGKGTYVDNILGNDYIISPHTFLQVNPIQTEKLYTTAMRMADIQSEDVVLDLYCGIGTISLLAAKKASKVIGIEVVRQSILDAKDNAKRNNIKNTRFICGKVEEKIDSIIKSTINPDIILLDPPRVGCEKDALKAITYLSPRKIVYISCNPATLARDVAYILEEGYAMKEVQAVDMFAHSSSVETVVLLEKRV